mmetsp:Transcript_15055/g.61443  ORF Transcript_15055/g.61443 Transcript_15055/m.61443 type:complete len:154 (+) Transcript_15055:1245-1706(+)
MRLRRMKGTGDEDEESEGKPDESKNISQSARRGGDDLEDDFVGSGSDETDGESAESDSEGPDVGVDQGAGHEASKKGVRFEEVSNILNHKRTDHENAGSLSPIQWNRPSALRTAMRARVRKSLSTKQLTQRRTRVTILFRSRSVNARRQTSSC